MSKSKDLKKTIKKARKDGKNAKDLDVIDDLTLHTTYDPPKNKEEKELYDQVYDEAKKS